MFFETLSQFLNNNRKTQFFNAVALLAQCKEDKVIYNVDFNSIKSTLNKSVEYAFREGIDNFCYDNYDKLDDDIKVLHDKNVLSLHDIISAHKLVGKIKNQEDPFVISYKKLTDELIDIAIDLKEIKKYIVKGRKESDKKIQEENPNKVVRTCPCCFRSIALTKSGTLVHHGFQRPGYGFQTPSCLGVDFEPYERSDKGSLFMVKLTKEQLEQSQSNLKKLELANIITEVNIKTKKVIEYGIDHPEFQYKKSIALSKNKSEVEQLKHENEFYNKKLKEWKKVE